MIAERPAGHVYDRKGSADICKNYHINISVRDIIAHTVQFAPESNSDLILIPERLDFNFPEKEHSNLVMGSSYNCQALT
jgi:hypothetical protein